MLFSVKPLSPSVTSSESHPTLRCAGDVPHIEMRPAAAREGAAKVNWAEETQGQELTRIWWGHA